jgi:hypothetical protein
MQRGREHAQSGMLAQSASAQSVVPSQSSSRPFVQSVSLGPPGHMHAAPEHVAPPGPHGSPAQSASAQSVVPSQSSSAALAQAASGAATCVHVPAPSQTSAVQATPSSVHIDPAAE